MHQLSVISWVGLEYLVVFSGYVFRHFFLPFCFIQNYSFLCSCRGIYCQTIFSKVLILVKYILVCDFEIIFLLLKYAPLNNVLTFEVCWSP